MPRKVTTDYEKAVPGILDLAFRLLILKRILILLSCKPRNTIDHNAYYSNERQHV